MRRFWGLFVMVLLWQVGCQPPRAAQGGFDSPDPASKLHAIYRAGNRGDVSTVAKLVEQLDSDDPAVRMMAIGALDRITGIRLGYNPYDSPQDRRQAIERWVQEVYERYD